MNGSRDRLTPLEMDAWGGFLRMHTLLYGELDRRLARAEQMPLSTYDVLLRLSWAGRAGLRMSELANQVIKTSGGVTRLADRLEREGLIERVRCPEDLRGFVARITPAGRRALRRANRRHLEDVRELFLDHLSAEELESLAAVWRRLRDANGHPEPMTAPSRD